MSDLHPFEVRHLIGGGLVVTASTTWVPRVGELVASYSYEHEQLPAQWYEVKLVTHVFGGRRMPRAIAWVVEREPPQVDRHVLARAQEHRS